ncbi:putative N-formylglutamate amidohydrolase [Loktanella ponticola]|uniref:Putative N-formylglutamate amidohydrolase n=1 Tax=Yoonia ponticola TaxID=1524255 RepID=A0A7W9BNF5_9RHOB|nr:N-formylglutamate amidohydrolase [Yoonia ponticola]MBB5723710.1 putative N-formylglutamate amidohydrolase [Yoonia ponticola]
MAQNLNEAAGDYVLSENSDGGSSIVLVCEHASHHIPARFSGLGLSSDARQSHAAWDPGAMGVATLMSKQLDAALVASGVSRLVYDCNRPPSALDAMPARSEVIDVPGNAGLTQADRDARTETYYEPFRAVLAAQIAQTPHPIIVTIHSFTPVYHGALRSVEIGVLHDDDTRLADALMLTAAVHTACDVQRNAPYGPTDGVTHTLIEHAVKHGHLNVMLEIRNDLIATATQQSAMAAMVSRWIVDACAQMNVAGDVSCQA